MWYILNFIPTNLVQNYLVLGTTYSSEITTTNFLIVFWKLSVEIALKCRVKITIRKTISYYYTRNCAREALDCAKCHFNSFNYVALANYLQAAIMELLHRFIQNVLGLAKILSVTSQIVWPSIAFSSTLTRWLISMFVIN